MSKLYNRLSASVGVIQLNPYVPAANIEEDDIAGREAAPVDRFELGENGQSGAADPVKTGSVAFVLHTWLFHSQESLAEVGQETWTLSTLGLSEKDRRAAELGIEFGGAQSCGSGYTRVAVRTYPKVNGPHCLVVLQLFCLRVMRL